MSKNKLLNVILLVLSGLLTVVKTIGDMDAPSRQDNNGDSWDMY